MMYRRRFITLKQKKMKTIENCDKKIIEAEEKIENLRIQIKEAQKNKMELEEEQFHFSKYVNIDWDIYIKWDSHILYALWKGVKFDIPNCIGNKLPWKHWKLEDLQEWDIFILKNDLKNIDYNYFNILIWQDERWNYITQYLDNTNWIECINKWIYYSYMLKEEIILFREDFYYNN